MLSLNRSSVGTGTSRNSSSSNSNSNSKSTIPMFALCLGVVILVIVALVSPSSDYTTVPTMRRSDRQTTVFLYHSDTPVARKKRRDLQSRPGIELVVATMEDQLEFLKSTLCVEGAAERFQAFRKHDQDQLARELYKYCALRRYGGLYLDADSPLLVSVDDILEGNKHANVAVQSDYLQEDSIIHGAILYLQNTGGTSVAERMATLLVETSIRTLMVSPLLIPKALHSETQDVEQDWVLYHHSCIMDPMEGRKLSSYQVGSRISHHCPLATGYCCHVQDKATQSVIMMTQHPIMPYQLLPDTLPQPYSTKGAFDEDDLPFISTISEKVHTKPKDAPITPNFFDTLVQNDCLPSDLTCSTCLREKAGADCKRCKDACPCFCKTLCHVSVDEKFVSKELTIVPPLYARDPNRLVPRIIHQTWFEDVTKDKYPNMSRLIESFKQSGWEYKFYTDDVSRDLLTKHFPPEVLEAYDTLRPGAFKADLFRYCVLLIYGGVYADMDVMLESNLDAAIAPDVGFMVPVDEPGLPVGKRMCLWNGFIAAAPGHPFLAKAIETVVNNIRNRFTSVDVDATFCPNPELSVLHAFDTLFTAGPCILGSVVNKALGRHGQTSFEPGPIDPWSSKDATSRATKATSFVLGDVALRIPGRTVILKQNKWDMGAHRFTLLEKNMVVAATDMPDYDDRINQEGNKEHYSKTHVKAGIYGLEKLYTDNVKANEDIRFVVNARELIHKK